MRRAFTLIELLVVIAIIAILAAILFPVFASAKTSAKVSTSLSNMKQIAIGLQIYSADYDDMAVHDYGTSYTATDTWVGDIYPYVKNRSIFFDPLVSEPRGDDFDDPFYPGYTYKWQWITNYAINVDGYSRFFGGTGCTNIDWSNSQQRPLSSIDRISERVTVAPVRYANLPWAWMRFYGIDASWPTMDRYATGWSWNQLVWDARRQYPGPRFVAAMADGSARKFGREKFVAYYSGGGAGTEANTYTEYCAKMDQKDLWPFWGRPWQSD